MVVDLHGFNLKDAKEEVICTLEDILAKGQRKVAIIHGYRNGQVLKNYFQSEQFLEDMNANGYGLNPKIHLNNPGMTSFTVKSYSQ